MTCNPLGPDTGELGYNLFDTDGTDYQFTFDYDRKHLWTAGTASTWINTRILAYHRADGETAWTRLTGWSMPANNSVRLTSEPSGGGQVLIKRDSNFVTKFVDWVDGARITEENLDRDTNQLFFLIQELRSGLAALDCEIDRLGMRDAYVFTGDGSTTEFVLEDGERSESGLTVTDVWVTINGVHQYHVDDDDSSRFTMADGSDGVSIINFSEAPPDGNEVVVIPLAIGSVSLAVDNGSITCDHFADGAICDLDRVFDLDDEGEDKQVLGWLEDSGGVAQFGAQTLDATWISGLLAFVQAVRINELASPNGNIDIDSNYIINVLDPVNDQDVATKGYVDDQIAGSVPGGVVTQHKLGTLTFSSSSFQTEDLGFEADWVEVSYEWTTTTSSGLPPRTISHSVTRRFDAATLASETTVNYGVISDSGLNPVHYGVTLQIDGTDLKYKRSSQATNQGHQISYHAIKNQV